MKQALIAVMLLLVYVNAQQDVQIIKDETVQQTKEKTPEILEVQQDKSDKDQKKDKPEARGHSLLDAKMQMEMMGKGYVNPDVKKQKDFKFYNNSYIYVSFRQKILDRTPSLNLSQALISDINKDLKTNFEKVQGIEIGEELNVTVKMFKLFKSFVIIDAEWTDGLHSRKKRHEGIAKVISNYNSTGVSPILAAEYLDHEKVFGIQATIKEMTKFKSKVKKQTVQWDPEIEQEKAEQKAKEEDIQKRQEYIEKRRAQDAARQAKEEKEAMEQGKDPEEVKQKYQKKQKKKSKKNKEPKKKFKMPKGMENVKFAEGLENPFEDPNFMDGKFQVDDDDEDDEDDDEDDEETEEPDNEEGQEHQGEFKIDPSDIKMEKDESLKFNKVEDRQLNDVTHLWKKEGSHMYMRTQEEYDADMKKEAEEAKQNKQDKKGEEKKFQEEILKKAKEDL